MEYITADNCPKAWNQLRLWVDANHDGVSQSDEQHTLGFMGVRRISLRYKESRRVDEYGNEFFYKATIEDADGPHDNLCYDVFLLEGSHK